MTARTVRVVGLDVSLTSTGVAVLGCTPVDEWTTHTYRARTTPIPGEQERETLGRMQRIRSACAIACEHADLVVMEAPAFSARGSATRTLAGLWWLVYDRLEHSEIPVVVVTPSALKKYATGKGNADKRTVSISASRMWPKHTTRSGDEDDALILASIGAHLIDLPVPYELTQYRRDALAAIRRPDGLEDVA